MDKLAAFPHDIRSASIWISWQVFEKLLKDLPTDPYAGGPYVMWEGSEFVHVMVPLEVTEPLD